MDETTLQDVIDDIRTEERLAKRALSVHSRLGGKHDPRVRIKPRTLDPVCLAQVNPGQPRAGHIMHITQGGTKWYPEHSAVGTTYHGVCRRCGATDTWVYGEAGQDDTGGLSYG